mmetsp:Transcript_63053/g.133092  ORF Transcript_63053/g.133092 Transcript_63053/m.133092 type:complete len:604 (+) Transcript_63053:96-1907(+)|eukprot:CAMPEP_0206465138 /NCGR_PEP_ID=MMETSP0324_2-20121206/27646_1 /ASSEMBLY_ACC=CAM_ASM_000836 /TAXON_ID=2866 /ORGANISM="Crypthecodinium cohnii, Strain Seligo" /LENGTH=603 /DNA_ID=CAMNT_0053937929 /DNA_START=30 /DNA_END=1841 /DNA_ORIENTATION=+
MADEADEWYDSIKDALTSPLSAILIAVFFVLALLGILAVVLWVRRRSKQELTQHRLLEGLIYSGHVQVDNFEKEAAVLHYRLAARLICESALRALLEEDITDEDGRAVDATSDNATSSSSREDPAAIFLACDEALRCFNESARYSYLIAFGVPPESTLRASPSIWVLDFKNPPGFPVELDEEHRITGAKDGHLMPASLCSGDVLLRLGGAPLAKMNDDEIKEHLAAASGKASFRRIGEEEVTLVCSRCLTPNKSEEDPGHCFRCFSCQASVLPWSSFVETLDASVVPPKFQKLVKTIQEAPDARSCSSPNRSKVRRVKPATDNIEQLLQSQQVKSLTVEAANLSSLVRHPSGFGRPSDPPERCKHHGQVGATCGLAAVNNVIVNCGSTPVDSRCMQAISTRLGQAEANLRDGADCVEEAGERQYLAELYAASTGGHFDVQTLQIAFEESGFSMWYENPSKLDHRSLFDWAAPATSTAPDSESAQGTETKKPDVVGYVIHRRDAVHARQDHWFVVRQHKSPEGEEQFLLQDSLFDEVFVLGKVEVQQLLISLPQGALFAVSRHPISAPETVPTTIEVESPATSPPVVSSPPATLEDKDALHKHL